MDANFIVKQIRIFKIKKNLNEYKQSLRKTTGGTPGSYFEGDKVQPSQTLGNKVNNILKI